MGFLSGLISPGLTATAQAVSGHQEGDIQAALMKMQQDRQTKEDSLKHLLQGLQAKNLSSEIFTREHPKPTYDSDRGVMVDGANATATPVAGVTPKDPVKNAVAVAEATKGIPTYSDLHPQGHFTPVTLGGDEGAPAVVKPFDTKTGTVGDAVGTAKPTLRIESAMNTAAKARLEAAVSEMNNAHHGMYEFEQGLKSGKYSINGAEQLGGRVANSFTHDDPISMGIQSAALATLNRANPELARYIRRGLSFAEGESMISQRPSDFRTKMAAFLSTAASGAHPEMISDIESRRTSILNPLNATVGKSPKSNPPEPSKAPSHTGASDPGGDIHLGKPSHEQALWDAAVAKYGEAVVTQKYGPRPQE